MSATQGSGNGLCYWRDKERNDKNRFKGLTKPGGDFSENILISLTLSQVAK